VNGCEHIYQATRIPIFIEISRYLLTR